jgi:4-hydroxy-3-polyprenylbenzoate decarboxylase
MGYRTLAAAVADLERTGQLVRIDQEIDPYLEAAEIHRRVYAAGGPALYFARVKGTRFPMASNLLGSLDRARFLFRDTLDDVRKLVQLKSDPGQLAKRPWWYWKVPLLAWRLRPKYTRGGPILRHTTSLAQLPQLTCWPLDGGSFATLPQVYTEHPDQPGWMKSNLGMYRVQMSGNAFEPDREVGLHYQIHRGIGVHHAAAARRGTQLLVNVIIGGPPALMVAAVMPLPEGLPELAFAGVLGGRRLAMVQAAAGAPVRLTMPAEADFVISGWIDPHRTKPEGPFGDHLGYYSLRHDFPVMTVENVYHRPGAIWPFTVVGRPPQEDTTFGQLIHELTGPLIPTVIPGLHAVHAVDAAGVHPLLLAVGSERYVPYAELQRPQELLTLANAILGQGQLSLAKYLLIVAKEDDPGLDIHDIPAFIRHLLERFDPKRDLHFQTCTTVDTLDYSPGLGLNSGSKLAIAAVGPRRRSLATTLPGELYLPDGFTDARVVIPGILAIRGPKYRHAEGDPHPDIARLIAALHAVRETMSGFPLVVVVDDAEFVARTLNNFLWVVFTRSDPARDVAGVGGFTHNKHWGCRGPIAIDARLKPYMPLPLEGNPAVTKRVDALFARGGPLAGI